MTGSGEFEQQDCQIVTDGWVGARRLNHDKDRDKTTRTS